MSRPVDRHTVDQLVAEHLPAALRLAQRLTGDADSAEEVVQEALCRILAQWKSYRGEAAFSTWMLQIVVNVNRDRRRRRGNVTVLSAESVSSAPQPTDHAIAAELSAKIRATIEQLPHRQREVALLTFGEGMNACDVARTLKITEANVHTCLHLARKRIAASIGVEFGQRKCHEAKQ